MDTSTFDFNQFLQIFGILILVGLVLSLILGAWVLNRIRKINLPPGADAVTALLMTPLSVVILLDLLDFTFDFLSAPFSWAILGRLGLKPLRGVTVIESLIPATQAIPTMTIAWAAVRLLKRDTLESLRRLKG